MTKEGSYEDIVQIGITTRKKPPPNEVKNLRGGESKKVFHQREICLGRMERHQLNGGGEKNPLRGWGLRGLPLGKIWASEGIMGAPADKKKFKMMNLTGGRILGGGV